MSIIATAATALTTIASVAAVVPSAICALALSGTLAVRVLAAAALQRTLGQRRVEARNVLFLEAEALGALGALLGVVIVLLDAEPLRAVGTLLGFFVGGRGGEAHGERGRRRDRLGGSSGGRGRGISLGRLSLVCHGILGRSIGCRYSLCSSRGGSGSGGGSGRLRTFVVAVRNLVIFGSCIERVSLQFQSRLVEAHRRISDYSAG